MHSLYGPCCLRHAVKLNHSLPQYLAQSLHGFSTPYGSTRLHSLWASCCPINSLAPGKFEWNFKHELFKQILVIDSWGISCDIALIWMSLIFTDDRSTLVQVMAWCRQATSHYLSRCWFRSMSPNGVTRPQWVDLWSHYAESLQFPGLWFIKQFIFICR